MSSVKDCKNREITAVIDHLTELSQKIISAPADIALRRRLLDEYFAVSDETVQLTLKPNVVQVGIRNGYWFVPEQFDGQHFMLYIHGGSWMSGSIKGWQAFMGRLATACECAILFIDYSLMPEAPFPAGLNDCLMAYQWLRENEPDGRLTGISYPQSESKKFFIAGDSAGGNLTLASLLAIKEQGLIMPNAAVAISPCTDFTASGASMKSRQAIDPIINAKAIPLLGASYMLQSEFDPTYPLASPLFGDLTGLPPVMIQTGEAEVLFDDSVRFAEKAQQAGVSIVLDTWPDMPHVFQGFAPYLPQAVKAIDGINQFLKCPLGELQKRT